MLKRIVIILTVILALAIGGWYALQWWSNRPAPVPALSTNQEPAAPSPIQPAPVQPVPSPAGSADRAVQVAAMTFAERYGTFSTDAPYENIKRILTLVTPSLAVELQASMKSGTLPGAGGFYGVTTRALSAAITSATETVALVKVSTQQQENVSRQGASQLSYKVLTLTLDHSSGAWLVSGARWEK